MQSKAFAAIPYIPLILKEMGLKELLYAVMMSDTFASAARNLGHPVAEFKWLVPSPGHMVIHIIPKNPAEPKIIFKLGGNFISGNVFSIASGRYFEENLEIYQILTQKLLGILKPEKFHFQSVFHLDFIFKYSKKFETFTMSGEHLTMAQARVIFDDLEIDVLKLENAIIGAGKCEPQMFDLKHREIHLESIQFLHFQSCLKMTTEKLFIGKWKVQRADLYAIVWLKQALKFGPAALRDRVVINGDTFEVRARLRGF